MAKEAINSVYEACILLKQGVNHNDSKKKTISKIRKNLVEIENDFQRCILELEKRLRGQLKERLGRKPSDVEITKEKENPNWIWISRYTDSLIKLHDAYNYLTEKNDDVEQESSNCSVCGELPHETLKVKSNNDGKIIDTNGNSWKGRIFCYKCFLVDYGKDNDVSGLPPPNSNPPRPPRDGSEKCVVCETFDNVFVYRDTGVHVCGSCICKSLKNNALTSLKEASGWELLTAEEQANFVNKINSLPTSLSSGDEYKKIRSKIANIEHEVAVFIQNKTEHNSSIDQKRIRFIKNVLQRLKNWDLLAAEEKQGFCDQISNSQPDQFELILSQAKQKIREKQPTEGGELQNPPFSSSNNNANDNNHSHDTDEHTFNLSLIQSQAKAEQEVEKIIKDNSISKEEEKELSEEICSGENWRDYLKKLDSPAKMTEFTNKVKAFALKKKLSRQTPTQDKKPENGWVLPVIISVLSILALTTTLILIIRKRRQKRF